MDVFLKESAIILWKNTKIKQINIVNFYFLRLIEYQVIIKNLKISLIFKLSKLSYQAKYKNEILIWKQKTKKV